MSEHYICKQCGELINMCTCHQAIPGRRDGEGAIADPVHHPAHYKQFGKETIDIIRDTLTPEEFAGYCKGNELKYRLRAGFKGDGAEDLAKAMTYHGFRQQAAKLNGMENIFPRGCEGV